MGLLRDDQVFAKVRKVTSRMLVEVEFEASLPKYAVTQQVARQEAMSLVRATYGWAFNGKWDQVMATNLTSDQEDLYWLVTVTIRKKILPKLAEKEEGEPCPS